jgi:cystathionine beta-synthase
VRDAEKDGARRAQVVAIDPVGSILGGGEPGNYEVEGIGYVSRVCTLAHAFTKRQDFFPEVLDPNPPSIDHWIKTTDEESFKAMKRLM